MDGGLVSASLSFSVVIKIVQIAHSENHHLLPVKVNISTLEVDTRPVKFDYVFLRIGSSPKTLQCVLHSYMQSMQNIYIASD